MVTPTSAPPLRWWLAGLAVSVLLQVGFGWLWQLWTPAPTLGFALSASFVVATVVLTCAFAPVPSLRMAALGVVPLAVLIGIGISGRPASDRVFGAVVLVALLTLGSAGGAFVGNRVAKAGWLFVVAYASSLVDAYSVFSASGPTSHVVQSEMLLSVLAIAWPVPGTHDLGPILGVGDVVMSALYLVAFRRHGLGMIRGAVALAVGFAATFSTAVALEMPLPALPFLGVAILAVHPRARRVPSEDRRSAIFGLGALTAFFCVLWILG